MQPSSILTQIRSWIGRSLSPDSDRELLKRFVDVQDQTAFAMLLDRHGPMILGLCRRILGDLHLAEDVFQATFLVLARKASSLRNSESLPAWLHRVAFRLAIRAKQSKQDQSLDETLQEPASDSSAIDDLSARELLAILDEELNQLRESNRSVIILCCLEGHSQEEAAKLLGCSPDSIRGRLERGRNQLRDRLAKRGLHLPTVLGTSVLLSPTIAVSSSTVSDTLAILDSKYVIPSRITDLAENVMHTTVLGKFQVLCLSLILICGFGFGINLLSAQSSKDKDTTSKTSEPVAKEKEETKGPRKDFYGDPLPEGALMRLGTIQRRAVSAQLAITKDGKSIISVRGGKYLSIWDAETGRLRESRTLPFEYSYHNRLSPDGRWLFTDGGNSSRLILVNVQTGKKDREFPLKDSRHISSTALSPDGKRLATNCMVHDTYRIQVWDIETQKEIFSQVVSTNASNNFIAFTPDGNEVIADFADGQHGLSSWNIESGKLRIQTIKSHASSAIFTPDGRRMLASSPGDNNAIDLMSAEAVKIDKMPEIESGVRVQFLPDGKRLLMAKEGGIVIWDREKGKEMQLLKGAGEDFVVAPDGKSIVTNDGSLQRWDLETGKPFYSDTFGMGHIQEVIALKFSANGKYLVSGAKDGSVRLWDTTTGKPLHVWRGHQATRPIRVWTWMKAGVQALDVSADGNWVVSAGSEEKVIVHHLSSQKSYEFPLPKPELGESERRVYHLRIDTDANQVVAIFGATGFFSTGVATTGNGITPMQPTDKIATWDMKTGKLLSVSRIESGSRDFSMNGRLVLRGGKVIDVSSQKELAQLEAPGPTSTSREPITFSPDGAFVIGTMGKLTEKNGQKYIDFGGIRVWETRTGKPIADLPIQRWVGQVGFLPNSRFAFTSDYYGISFWDLLTEKKIHQQKMPEKINSTTTSGTYESCVAFSPGGKRMATGHPDSTILIWDLPRPSPSNEKIDAKLLEPLWTYLEGKDAKKAWRYLWDLADSPTEVLPILRNRLKPVKVMNRKEIQPLIQALDDAGFAKREQAMKQLIELGPQTETALREALQDKPSIEQEKRIHQILSSIKNSSSTMTTKLLAEIRAIRLLEQIGTPDAKELLTELSKGAKSALLTHEAKDALERMDRK